MLAVGLVLGLATCGPRPDSDDSRLDSIDSLVDSIGSSDGCWTALDFNAQTLCVGNDREIRCSDGTDDLVFPGSDIWNSGQGAVCWRTTDLQWACEGYHMEDQPLGLAYAEPGSLAACGLVDGRARCWGMDEFSETSAPDAIEISDLSMGVGCGAAVSSDGTIHVWGEYCPAAPAGTYSSVEVGYRTVCGTSSAGSTCTSVGEAGFTLSPVDGDPIAVGAGWACALADSGSVTCSEGAPTIGNGPWSGLACGIEECCTIDPMGRLSCFGQGPDRPSLGCE